jgi:hypothetical protein
VQDEPLERLAALRDDEQPMGRSPGHEGFLDRATAGDELLVLSQEVRRRDSRAERGSRTRPGLPRAILGGTPIPGPVRPRPVETLLVETRSVAVRAILAGTVEASTVWSRAKRARSGPKAALASPGGSTSEGWPSPARARPGRSTTSTAVVPLPRRTRRPRAPSRRLLIA